VQTCICTIVCIKSHQLCKPHHYLTLCIYSLHNRLNMIQTVIPTQYAYKVYVLTNMKRLLLEVNYFYFKFCQKLSLGIVIDGRDLCEVNKFYYYYTPTPRRGRGVYCFTSVRPSVHPRYFSSHFSQ
jgi:hypothetical protein